VKSTDRVGIIFNDITRATPNALIIEAILSEITHVPESQVLLFNALGTHRKNSKEELYHILSPELVERFQIIQNNCTDKSTQKCIGRTHRGNDVWINGKLMECDLIIATGFIEPHFFAGFSGGGKAIMPGMAGLETILSNHDARMIGDQHSIWGEVEHNPIQQEVREIIPMIKNSFLVNVTLNREQKITGVYAGDLIATHDIGCAKVKESAMIAVENPFDIVVTTNSGYPLDQNLYQSVKGMRAADQVVKEGGAIIIAAECRDGLPDHGLYGDMLLKADNPAEILNEIKNASEPWQDQWQVQVHAQIASKADIFVYSEYLSKETLENRLLRKSDDIAGTIYDLVEHYGAQTRICVLPEGPLTIPYLKNK
jgi:nickel-dependent lactate racemase